MDDKCTFYEFVFIWNELCGYDVPEIHERFINFIETTEGVYDRRIIYAFRESGKSYIISLYVAWKIYLDANFTAVIVSAEGNLATERARFIKEVIETHPLTKHLAPTKENLKRYNASSETSQLLRSTWRKNNFTVIRSKVDLAPTCRVLSIGSSLAGAHADISIIDDAESEKNVQTSKSREDLKRKFSHLLSVSQNRMLVVGTPHHEESLYEHLREHSDFHWLTQTPYKDGSPPSPKWLDGDFSAYPGEPIWPEVVSIERLQTTRRNSSTGFYLSQYMLIPSTVTDSVLEPTAIRNYKLDLRESDFERTAFGNPKISIGELSVRKIVGYWDSALGQSYGDRSVLAIAAMMDNNDIYVLDIVTLPEADLTLERPFEKQFRSVLAAMKRYHCREIYIESNFIKTLPSELAVYAKAVQQKIKVHTVNRTSSQNKKKLITDTLQPVISFGRLYIPPHVRSHPHFLMEVKHHPYSTKDDCIDALTGAIMHLPGVKSQAHKAPAIRHGFGNSEMGNNIINRYTLGS
jgi:hypothetical protein